MNSGAVSSSILKIAGSEIQRECQGIMKARAYKIVSSTEAVVSKGYSLNCRYVFHGALAHDWGKQVNCSTKYVLNFYNVLKFLIITGTSMLCYSHQNSFVTTILWFNSCVF